MSINNTILGAIVKQAKIKWDNISEETANQEIEKILTAEEARRTITYYSDIKVVSEIAQIADLDDEEINQIIEDISSKMQIRTEIANKIRNKIRQRK